jgi:hypothetical protein
MDTTYLDMPKLSTRILRLITKRGPYPLKESVYNDLSLLET